MNFARLKKGPGRRPIKDQAQEARQFSTRAMTAFILISVAVGLLVSRFIYLQVASFEEFSTRSTSNQVRVTAVSPNRGLVYDRRGRPIAENRPAYRLELVPEEIEDLGAVLAELGLYVDLSEDVLERFQRNRPRYRVFDSVPLKFNLGEEEVARFAVNRHRFDGVEIYKEVSEPPEVRGPAHQIVER